MIEARRRAYLEALGFEVWVTRRPAAEAGRIVVGAGQGSTLLVCPSAAECRTELAADLVRALGGDPVWAWLGLDADESGQVLEEVVAARLITRVFLFGQDPARSLFHGSPPEILGSARLTVLPGLQELAVSGTARRDSWKQLRDARSGPSVAPRTDACR